MVENINAALYHPILLQYLIIPQADIIDLQLLKL